MVSSEDENEEIKQEKEEQKDVVLPEDQLENDPLNAPNMADGEEQQVNAVEPVKVPPFWRNNPNKWFIVAESVFALRRITSDDSKYRYVIVNLDSETLDAVGDLVETPPEADKYKTIKDRIISVFGESTERRLRRLLRSQTVAFEKPSLCLQRMRTLAGGNCTDPVLRSLFLEQLPENIRGVVAVNDTEDLSRLAAQADRVYDTLQPNINAVHSTSAQAASANAPQSLAPGQPSGNAEMNEIRQSIAALTRQVAQLSRGRSKSPAPRNNYRRENLHHSNDDPDSRLCYYHKRFGENAKKCRRNCEYYGKEFPKNLGN